jgi:hypothetical protein
VPRKVFEPKSDEVPGGWRKLYNEELHKFYSSPSIIRMIKSRVMLRAGHVAQIGRSVIGGKGRRKETTRKTKN